ncbi:hypothetical protein F511_27269 [Dorcoceras hygrometricum]|uniref:Uncharacterized protein n=1 Tax=Dorcoceras hygrometricum TaxID=472368 RepID=A0A2Z7B1M0_9LAMI|nr:hypothetical protein F511_27269 [Dorcoceras hygrometricum]
MNLPPSAGVHDHRLLPPYLFFFYGFHLELIKLLTDSSSSSSTSSTINPTELYPELVKALFFSMHQLNQDP